MNGWLSKAGRPIIGARALAALLLAGLVSGCSMVRLAYGQLENVAYWRIDSHLDLDGEQERVLREQLAGWMQWHRQTQLPVYAQALAGVQREVLNDVTPQQVCQRLQQAMQWREAAFERAAPAIARVASDLRPQQVQHLQRQLDKSNREFAEEHLDPDPQRRHEKAVKRAVERAERLYGRLDASQREWIDRALRAAPRNNELWFEERLRRQQDGARAIGSMQAQQASGSDGTAAARAFLQRVALSPEPRYRQHAERWTAHSCEFAAALHNRTTPEQRQQAVARLRGWEADLRALSGQPAGSMQAQARPQGG